MTAEYLPSEGSGTTTCRPEGDRSVAAATSNQSGMSEGSSPRSSSSRRASVVSPSPQHLSRGNTAASARTTSRPERAAQAAAAEPAGPAPTTRTSVATGTALAGTGSSVPVPRSKPRTCTAEQGERVDGVPQFGAVGGCQRLPARAAPGGGDVVSALREWPAEQPASAVGVLLPDLMGKLRRPAVIGNGPVSDRQYPMRIGDDAVGMFGSYFV